MSTAALEHDWSWDYLLKTWRDLDAPEGWRAEIIHAGIALTPPPALPHNLVADTVHRALVEALPRDWAIFQTVGVAIPLVEELYIPDFAVVRRGVIPADASELDGHHITMAVEITSKGNARHDRNTKKWGYAHGGVPLYLLIDAWDAEGAANTLFADPVDGAYRQSQRTAFGEPITIPAPLDLQVETSEFPRP